MKYIKIFTISLLFFTLSLLLLSYSSLQQVFSAPAQADHLPPPEAILELDWEPVPGASGYELRFSPLHSSGGEKVFQAEENQLKPRLPVGIYKLQMRSKDRESGYYGPWGEATEVEVAEKSIQLLRPQDNGRIEAPNKKTAEVTFEWTSRSDAKIYLLKIWSEDSDQQQEFRVTENVKSVNLITGHHYTWTVTMETSSAVSYEKNAMEYHFTLLGDQLVAPVVEHKSGRISWSESAEAENYSAKIYKRFLDESKWTLVEKIESTDKLAWRPQARVGGLKPAAYRVEIVAKASRRVSSDPGILEFSIKPKESEVQQALEASVRALEPKSQSSQ